MLQECKKGHIRDYMRPDGYLECRVCRRNNYRRWAGNNPEKARTMARKNMAAKRLRDGEANNYFGGNRVAALKRDNYMCVICGMTRQQHQEKYGRDITVDHIDGSGRYSANRNNNLENLQALCLVCHGKKDGIRRLDNYAPKNYWFDKQTNRFKVYIKQRYQAQFMTREEAINYLRDRGITNE